MRKTASGRWVPDKPGRIGSDVQAAYVMSCQWAKEITPMPAWWPVMSFEAAVGRLHMQDEWGGAK